MAFVSDSANPGGSSIFLMHADGSHKISLTSPHFHDAAPAWSPDGSSITFETDRQPAGIWIMNADGSNQRSLLSRPQFDSPFQLNWSRNGHSIAFVEYAGSQTVIMIADADGSHAHRLTTNTFGELWPSWSPDGSKIAFMAPADSVGVSIFVVGSDGTAQQRLTYGADVQPEWSPDGSRIAFATVENGSHFEIAIMQQDGSDRHTLTTTGDNLDPAWSPDGRQLAYDGPAPDSLPGGFTNIYRINVNGSDAREITSVRFVDLKISSSWAPAWKPTP